MSKDNSAEDPPLPSPASASPPQTPPPELAIAPTSHEESATSALAIAPTRFGESSPPTSNEGSASGPAVIAIKSVNKYSEESVGRMYENRQSVSFGLRGVHDKEHEIEQLAKAGLTEEEIQKTFSEASTAAKRLLAEEERKRKEEDERNLTWRQKVSRSIKLKEKYHQELVLKGGIEIKVVYNDGTEGFILDPVHPLPRLRRFVLHSYFESAMTVLIMANCVIIGWQAELPNNPEGSVKVINAVIEQFFTTMFFLELFCKISVYNWTFCFDSANYLDMFLVFLSVLNAWILGPLQVEADFLRKATVLRILRLVRIARTFKRRFKEMWQLIRGLVDSFETLLWTYVMMLCVLYLFGIVATMLFYKMDFFEDDEIAKVIVKEDFDTVVNSMYTLFRIMTLDSWTAISRPLAEVHPWSQVFFIIYISVSVFLLMNLITAVIVDQAFKAGEQDVAEVAAEKEQANIDMERELRDMFAEIDADGSGEIDKEELNMAWRRRDIRKKFLAMDVSKKDLLMLWDALDTQGDGKLDTNEFIPAVRKLKGEAKSKDIMKLYREVRGLEDAVHIMEQLHPKYMKETDVVKKKVMKNVKTIEATRRTLMRIQEHARVAVKAQAMTWRPEEKEDEE